MSSEGGLPSPDLRSPAPSTQPTHHRPVCRRTRTAQWLVESCPSGAPEASELAKVAIGGPTAPTVLPPRSRRVCHSGACIPNHCARAAAVPGSLGPPRIGAPTAQRPGRIKGGKKPAPSRLGVALLSRSGPRPWPPSFPLSQPPPTLWNYSSLHPHTRPPINPPSNERLPTRFLLPSMSPSLLPSLHLVLASYIPLGLLPLPIFPSINHSPYPTFFPCVPPSLPSCLPPSFAVSLVPLAHWLSAQFAPSPPSLPSLLRALFLFSRLKVCMLHPSSTSVAQPTSYQIYIIQ